jgi:micrococcal nuclease
MIQTGYAWHYLKYDSNNDWSILEREARLSKKGLWTLLNATPPWQWRKR